MLPPGVDQALRLFFPSTVLYNPKAFIPHAASLGQACAHCRRSSTAASRRSLASVPVPVAQVVLSHLLDISGLVGHYPASRRAIPNPRVGTHALLPLTPVPPIAGDSLDLHA